jgi:aminopeptidase N
VQSTVLEVDFAQPLDPGATAEIDLRFTTTLPMDSTGSYGIFTRHSDSGDWIASDWCPIVAGHDATGWRVDPPSLTGGDPTFSDAAVYSVKLTAPSSFTLITSGAATKGETSGGLTAWSIENAPLREFTFVASPSLQRFERKVGNHLLAVYLHAGADQAALAKLTLDAAEHAFTTYESLFGAYPWPELDVIDVRLLGALGVSWTGLLFINGGLLFPHAQTDSAPLRFTVAHEVSHQWWGALVGSNTNDHAFLAEGLANCSAVLAILATQGEGSTRAQLENQIVQPYLRALAESGDGVVDRASTAQAAGPSLTVLIYAKAALGFLAIREALGPDAFAAALRAYVADFSWRVSQPSDLRAEFEAKSKDKVGPLWAKWFDSASVNASDVAAIENALS